MKTKKIVATVVVVVLLILLLNLSSSVFYIVEENQFACVVRFSKIIQTVETAGLNMKVPFIDDVIYFPKTKLFYDLIPSEVLTSDSKAMSVDSFIVWRIINPLTFYQTLGTISPGAESRLDATVYNILKNVIGTIPQNDIISSADEQSRDYLNNTVSEQVKALVGAYGIEVHDVKIKKFELPTDNEQSVFNRMISDRNRIAELYRAEGTQEANMIKNDVDKKVNIIVSDAEARAEQIIAEGESEYMALLAEAYNSQEKKDFFVFIRGLEAAKASLSKGDKTLILDRDSVLAKILVGE